MNPTEADSQRAKISPLPWHASIGEDETGEYFHIVSNHPKGGIDYIADVLGERTASNAEANARFIVHCVNNHEALVNALETAANGLKMLAHNLGHQPDTLSEMLQKLALEGESQARSSIESARALEKKGE